MIRLALGLILISLLVGCGNVGIKYIDPGTPPSPSDTISYEALAELLEGHVHGAHVDYKGLVADQDSLKAISAMFGATGPNTHPDLFPSQADRLAYYINAYNTLVLLGVVSHYPIETVNDVHGRLKITRGFGFFYGLRFALDGERTHLYGLEHDVIREFGDARIHGAINCASASCPTLLDRPYLPETLDEQLEAAAMRFANEDRHVSVDHSAKVISLSPIYDWFKEDFIAHSQAQGFGAGVMDYILHYAQGDKREALKAGREAGYEIRYPDYDWSLNEAPSQGVAEVSAP